MTSAGDSIGLTAVIRAPSFGRLGEGGVADEGGSECLIMVGLTSRGIDPFSAKHHRRAQTSCIRQSLDGWCVVRVGVAD